MIADEFRLSEGYLSKLFIKLRGNSERIFQSCSIMACGRTISRKQTIRLSDIAIGNGFPNVKSFNQALKEKM